MALLPRLVPGQTRWRTAWRSKRSRLMPDNKFIALRRLSNARLRLIKVLTPIFKRCRPTISEKCIYGAVDNENTHVYVVWFAFCGVSRRDRTAQRTQIS